MKNADFKTVVIDIDANNLFLMSEYLGLLNIRAHVLNSKHQAIEWVKHEKPDLIFVNIDLCNEVTKKLIETINLYCSNARIVMMTAVPETEIVKLCFKMGIQEYINKPILLPSVKRIINSFQKQCV